jgi:hypothetical protein
MITAIRQGTPTRLHQPELGHLATTAQYGPGRRRHLVRHRQTVEVYQRRTALAGGSFHSEFQAAKQLSHK